MQFFMRSALYYLILITLLIGSNTYVSAQKNVFEQHLDSLKRQNNLTDWIYDRLDHVAENTQVNLAYLMNTKPWRQAKLMEEHHAILTLLNSKGYYQLLDGNILTAIRNYEDAYSYYQKNKVGKYEIVEYTLKPLSNCYTRLGDYERALYLQHLSINFLIKTNDLPETIASVYSNLAISYRSMGNTFEAEKSALNGLKLTKTNTSTYLLLNNILADILIDNGDDLGAAKLIENNIAKQKNINTENGYSLMGSYTTGGIAYLNLKNYKKAELYLNKALYIINTFFKGARLREQANIFTLKGRVKLQQQQPLLAIKDFKQTLLILKVANADGSPIVSKIYGDNKLVEVFEQMANAYLDLHKPDEAFNYIKLALFSADKIRNEFANDQTKERLQADLKYITEKGIDLAYQRYLQTKDKKLWLSILELAEQSKARTLFDQIKRNQQSLLSNRNDSLFIKKQAFERAIIYNEKQELEAKNKVANKNTDSLKFYLALIDKQIKQKYKQFNLDNELNVAKLLKTLPKANIIEYFVGRNAIYAIIIKDGQVNQVVKLAHADQIKLNTKTYADHYFQQGPNAMLNDPKTFYSASHQLYQQLLGQIKFGKGEKVVVIPDEVLGYLSFDGLITDAAYQPQIAKWPFLIKQHILTYAFSLQTLALAKPVALTKNFTGLFITHQKNNNKPLKAVQDEADAIKNLLSGRFLFNDEVNTQTFNTAFEQSTVLHIGTHAYLSGKNQEPTLDFEKGKLFLFELDAKKNAPVLVVLSACRTADGLLANGEGIISLSRGFNALGTPATIAGLWNVNDVAASVITSSLYEHLLEGKSGGEALHQAKLDWLNKPQTSDALYLPYYWDSLIYMGTDQQIALTPATNWSLLLGFTGGIIALAGFFFLLIRRSKMKRIVPQAQIL